MEKSPTINIFIMGKQYKVPRGLPIQKALEAAGYKLSRGCGCRGGFCGACGTVYRIPGDFKLKVGLACRTMIEENMNIVQLSFFPSNKADYDIRKLDASSNTIMSLYPEVFRCLQCNTCSKICPQDINVMGYIACAMKGDIEGLAEKSFNCLMCGLCSIRCPAELVQHQVALLGRRLYGRYVAKKAVHLKERLEEIKAGKFEPEYKAVMAKNKDELKKMYEERDIKK